MLLPTRGKYLCEIIARDKQLPSGIWIADKIKGERNDNVCRCLGAGDPAIKTCYSCHDKRLCKNKCRELGRTLPIIARRADIIHFKTGFGARIRYERKDYVFLQNQDTVAVERDNQITAVGSMVIIKLQYAQKAGKIFIPDAAKLYSGEYWGDVVSVGPDYPDKRLKIGDKIIYMRNEGYKFRGWHDRRAYYAIKEKWIWGRYE